MQSSFQCSPASILLFLTCRLHRTPFHHSIERHLNDNRSSSHFRRHSANVMSLKMTFVFSTLMHALNSGSVQPNAMSFPLLAPYKKWWGHCCKTRTDSVQKTCSGIRPSFLVVWQSSEVKKRQYTLYGSKVSSFFAFLAKVLVTGSPKCTHEDLYLKKTVENENRTLPNNNNFDSCMTWASPQAKRGKVKQQISLTLSPLVPGDPLAPVGPTGPWSPYQGIMNTSSFILCFYFLLHSLRPIWSRAAQITLKEQ